MKLLSKNLIDESIVEIERLWRIHNRKIMYLAIVIMTTISIIWLGYEFWRLVLQPGGLGKWGAIDLKLRHRDVLAWFARIPIYRELTNATYPPASYLMLWPMMGWLTFEQTRWFWAITTIIALCWLIYLLVKESGASQPREKVFIALIPLSMYATGATIGNGQVTIHLVTCLLTGLLLLKQKKQKLYRDLLAASMFIITLIKPTISVPFFWLFLLKPKNLKIASFIVLGYLVLSLFAASFQDIDTITLFKEWLDTRSGEDLLGGKGIMQGHGNIHKLLFMLGFSDSMLLVSLLILIGLALWIWRYKDIDYWIIIGVSAFVAYFWLHHRWYDGLLILFPIITLFRITKQNTSTQKEKTISGILLAFMILSVIAPGGIYFFPPPWNGIYELGQMIIWLIVLIFLMKKAHVARGKLKLLSTSVEN